MPTFGKHVAQNGSSRVLTTLFIYFLRKQVCNEKGLWRTGGSCQVVADIVETDMVNTLRRICKDNKSGLEFGWMDETLLRLRVCLIWPIKQLRDAVFYIGNIKGIRHDCNWIESHFSHTRLQRDVEALFICIVSH